MSDKISAAIESVLRKAELTCVRLVVGVSGGPDSLALLFAALERRACLSLELVVAHLDHGLRVDSDADARFVVALGQKYDVPVVVGDARSLGNRPGGSSGVEAAARHARYAFFSNVVETRRAAAVLVGHTANDQVETRLMHLARGTGLRGLRGMVADGEVRVPTGERVRVVRPLLTCSRVETMAFCQEHGVEPRVDPSNRDLRFTRNRLRHTVLPALHAINPSLQLALERLAIIATDAEAFVEAELDHRIANLANLASRHEDAWSIDRTAWRGLPRALKTALIRRVLAGITPSTDVGADAIEKAIEAIDAWPAGTVLHLPAGRVIRLCHDGAAVDVDRKPMERPASIPIGDGTDVTTKMPGFVAPCVAPQSARRLESESDIALRFRRVDEQCRHRTGDPWHADLDRARLGEPGSLLVRSRELGDVLFPVGMNGRKKVQDLLVDSHIPRDDRDSIPIVATTDGRVVWVVGIQRDRRFVAEPTARDVVCLEVMPLERKEPAVDPAEC